MSSEALRRLVLFHFLLKSWKPQKRTFLRRLKQSSTLRLVTVLLGLPRGVATVEACRGDVGPNSGVVDSAVVIRPHMARASAANLRHRLTPTRGSSHGVEPHPCALFDDRFVGEWRAARGINRNLSRDAFAAGVSCVGATLRASLF